MRFTDAERRLIAAGWSSASCDQVTYAAKHGVSTRALRSWVQRYGVGDRPQARARVIVERAIRELEALLAGLDAEAARQNGEADQACGGGTPERRNTPDLGAVTSAAHSSASMPRPAPPSGFFAGF